MVDVYEFPTKSHTICDGYCYFMQKNDRIGKIELKVTFKDKWKTLDVIPLLPLVGVNHSQPILHLYKIMVDCYSIDDSINPFAIGYMINPSLHLTKVFREQVERYLSAIFHKNTMENTKDCLGKKNSCVMAIIMFYENNGVRPK